MKARAVCLMVLSVVSWTAMAEPTRMLPAPPGQILDLRANAAGDLYVRTATNVLWMDLQNPEEGWNTLALDRVVDLTENAGREVFARQDLKTRFAIHRLVGGEAKLVTTTTNAPCERWYVDALGRAWIQTKARLLVIGKEEPLLDTPVQRLGTVFRQPCEWQPGQVALICGTEAIWAGPDNVTVDPAPPFAGDAMCVGPYRLGKDRLLAGCDRRSFRVSSGLVDPRKPAQPPERLALGWDWFYGMVTAPDGRLLVLGQTDNNPQFTFFWYAADGRSQVRLKGAESVIRAGRTQHGMAQLGVVFASTSVGFAAIADGTLAVFGPDEVSLVTPNRGLPIPRVEHLATVGDDLIMAGGGKMLVWRTTEPLPQPAVADLREWQLAGPCVRDVNGMMWAFLLDYPGKLSRHDGKRWDHIAIELGNRNPYIMTGDDRGRLQIGFMDAPSGSFLVNDGAVTNWPDYNRAWTERFDAGPTFFRDGSPFRPRHVVAGKDDWVWMYDGRTLRTGQKEYDYYESPPYRCFWLGAGGTCYRGGAGRVVWIFANGRWTETEAPPLSIGPDGLRADAAGKDRLPVVYDGQPKLVLPGASAGSKTRFLTLQGNEAFIPAADGGGWVGQYRVFRDVYYPLSDRVYPGTNGHYLVADKTLRFQPRQTLTIAGDVVSTGAVKRLVCKIAGSEPLYQPRLLAFLDGEFLEGISSPDGADLPPVRPGAHTLDVYAADGFGVVSEQPLRLTIDGAPEFEVVHLALGEDWNLKPQRLQILPAKIAGRSVLGQTLEIDAEGVVWILVEGGVISIDLTRRQAAYHRCPVQELVGSGGRVWARGKHSQDRLSIPLYELRRDGVRHAAELYDDSSYASKQISADGEGGIWALGHRSAVRWDGKQTRQWERPLDFDARVEPSGLGAIIHTRSHYLVYRNGELSQAIPWSGDFKDRWQQADRIAYPLGRDYLVLTGQRLLLEADSGRLSERKIPFGDTYRAGPNSSLYVWKGKEFYRISGDDLAVTQLVYSTAPTMPPLWDPGGYEFLATTGGVVAYTVRSEQLIIGQADKGAVAFGWSEGVQPGRTAAIREAPDGRLWILRRAQLLVYDPTQPAGVNPSAWPGWRAAPVRDRFEVGAFGHVWYRDPERRVMACTDGTNETTWAMNDSYGEIVVADQGAAAVFSGSDACILAPAKPVERMKDPASAVLELIKRGAKSFEGEAPPAVAADGRVYFRGRIWDGQAWQRAPDGRASLDPRGEIFLLCAEPGPLPVAYRLDGIKAIPLGAVEKCLIDAYGLRWYDAGLMEANPGSLPVWYASKEQPQVSFDLNTARARIDPHGSLQALPLGDGQFLVRVGARLHRLDARGITAIPGDQVPCGDELDPGWGLRVWRLADGRWALAVHSRLYISPPGFCFRP